MKYNIEITTNGQPLGKFVSQKEFPYNKMEKVINVYIFTVLKDYEKIWENSSSDYVDYVYINKETAKSVFIRARKYCETDLLDSEGK